jgi:hypothetical protein
MSKITKAEAAFLLVACVWVQPILAADHLLDFKLVVKLTDVKTVEAPDIEGQVILTAKAFGVAFFKDGRVASKEFVYNQDSNKGSGPFIGYSTYTFQDGSSITARFSGTQKAGEPTHGEYVVVSGTGAYAGVKGTGTFDSVPHKLKGANLLDGKFKLTTP